ncbi:hypothetical protein DPMN_094697 [Dreissena polymorpha]|uniref:Uncharacterized protein n=1 Tax=Dreissena polymorpha TaxID=45954 RepID=A0A9D4R218_DREPO|nr:hypothetical protein DPMN_094697 [Dreissena polymorpha]
MNTRKSPSIKCSKELAPTLSHIFQLSLDNGTLPGDWRNANIINYRPQGLSKRTTVKTSSVTSMMNELGWKLLAHRRREQRLTLLFKIIHGLVAIPANDHITFNKQPSRTGHSQQIKVIATKTDI